MKHIHLASIDLNLLVVFDALAKENHATRAAVRIGLTQPAISHALNRLRALFDDPLFVRSPHGMTPTPAAQKIAPAVHSILEQLEGVLRGGIAFDPVLSDRQFVLGLSDYAALVILPPLMTRLDQEAPEVSLVIRNASRNVGLGLVDDGSVELIVGNFPGPPSHMREELLYEEDFVCATRSDHPSVVDAMNMDDYLSLRHLQVSTKGDPHGYVDAVLAEQGLQRRVVLTVGHFLMAPLLADASNLIATEPRRLFYPLAGRLPLRLCKPPFEIPPFRVVQTWHTRYNADPGHQWLRGLLREIVNQK